MGEPPEISAKVFGSLSPFVFHPEEGFYDGADSERENYEEHCGLAMSTDLLRWTKLTTEQPAIVAPHGTRSVRYVEAVLKDGELHCYYEYARADGAHELRHLVVHATH